MIVPSEIKIREYVQQGFNVIPVCKEMNADLDTPVGIYKKMQMNMPCFLLESVESGQGASRYTFIGLAPKKNYVHQKGADSPLKEMALQMNPYKSPVVEGLPLFTGGAVGYFAYDVVRYEEHLPHAPKADFDAPDAQFLFVDDVIAFDHQKHKLFIISNMHVNDESEIEAEYNKSIRRIEQMVYGIEKGKIPPPDTREIQTTPFVSNFAKEAYLEAVEKAKQLIRNGDIFQVVLSQRFCCETNAAPFHVYRSLRRINPSPYMYYLDFGGYQLVGASPEMLLKVTNRKMETCPIAGTRKRGATDAEDQALINDLLQDEKEVSEHNMLVDLGRNDIGRVAEIGSVAVTEYMQIHKFSHVSHLVSKVTGRLKEGLTAFDALGSVLPAGTLSGAPKVRAMEIIDAFEKSRRNFYGGAVCYIGYNGGFDSCITIRTVLLKDGKAYTQAGGGIVYDSEAEKEYEETINKARAIFAAIEEGGQMQ